MLISTGRGLVASAWTYTARGFMLFASKTLMFIPTVMKLRAGDIILTAMAELTVQESL